MNKIGIISINGNENFGNKLQLYAMCQILKDYGEPFNIVKYDYCENQSLFDMLYISMKKNIKKVGKQILKKEYHFTRYINFLRFNKLIPNYKKILNKHTNYSKLDKYFDYFVCGSDQVWNPVLYPNMNVNMLSFTTNRKKIAIAPSIALDELTSEQKNTFHILLEDFDNLSCREEQGAQLIRNITNKDVVSLMDPTLMITGNLWDKIIKKPKFHDENEKYILLYFLGDISESYSKTVKQLSEKYNLKIINLLDKKSRYYSCGPKEFVYLIKNCEIMLTDSFHGSVFSYIYNKPFRIFYRQGDCGYMNSRLTNLMQKLHLNEDMYITENTNLDNILETNYDKNYLKIEQEKFKKYLDEILK